MEVLVNTYRGDLVDLVSTGSIAVVNAEGKLLYYSGDPHSVAYARSSAKLMQAVVPVMTGAVDAYGISPQEIAQIAASHSGEQIHIDTVRGILKKADIPEEALQCGTHYPFKADVAEAMKRRGEEPQAVHNNCSGKHAGMLITVKHLGEELETYYQTSHPHQKRIIQTIGDICGYAPENIGIGLDGCGVPVHALPLDKFACGMARMCQPETLPEKYQEAADRVVNAVLTHPLNTSGSDRIDYKIITRYPGKIVVKSGANGYFTGGLPGKGIGFAIKTNDGISEMRNSVLVELLHQIGVIPEEDLEYFDAERNVRVYNHKNELAGYSVPVFQLKKN
ncbi:asparaginase [[Clostridium] scindens]|uniref:asparaginase n=1 Tax=Clostridium scindens (strain JCM 10418 / VPI 12708) TaxID=29347 RepID=UPI0039A1CC47